ncbi:MAG: glycosyltransferase family 39 protein [Pseudomonadota bacterium]
MIRMKWLFGTVAAAIVIYTLIAGSMFRAQTLKRDSLWFDEIVTLELAQSDWTSLFPGILERDSHPPLFLLLAKPWVAVFGASDQGGRSLSAVIGVASLAAMFWLGWIAGGYGAAIASVVLTAFHHFALFYSSEFRSYILFFLLTALSLCFFLRMLRLPKCRKVHWIGLVLSNSFLLLTHYFAILLVAFECFAFLSMASSLSLAKRRNWWTSQAVTLVMFSFWMPGLAYHALHLKQSHLLGAVKLPDLLSRLSPVGGSLATPGGPAYAGYIAFLFLALWVLSFPAFKRWKGGNSEPRAGLVAVIRENSGLFKRLGVLYLAGSALIFLSRPLYGDLKAIPTPLGTLVLEGFLVFSWVYVFLVGMALMNLIRPEGGLTSQRKAERLQGLVLAWFPVFLLFAVEIACKAFRPVYEPRNVILILPFMVTGVALVLARVRPKGLWLAVMVVLLVGLRSQLPYAQFFRTRFGYRGVASEIKGELEKFKDRPGIVTMSPEAATAMRYYMKEFDRTECLAGCENVKGRKQVLWVWHTFNLASESTLKPFFFASLENGKTLWATAHQGIAAAWVEYPAGFGPATP